MHKKRDVHLCSKLRRSEEVIYIVKCTYTVKCTYIVKCSYVVKRAAAFRGRPRSMDSKQDLKEPSSGTITCPWRTLSVCPVIVVQDDDQGEDEGRDDNDDRRVGGEERNPTW